MTSTNNDYFNSKKNTFDKSVYKDKLESVFQNVLNQTIKLDKFFIFTNNEEGFISKKSELNNDSL